MSNEIIEIPAWGDEVYEISFDGTMWVNPATGQQFARPSEAMRVVLWAAAIASGDDPEENEEIAQEIESYIDAAIEAYYAD